MYRILNKNPQRNKYVAETVDDLRAIRMPEFGDTAFVIETKDTYMQDAHGTWKCITSSAGDIICDCISEMTIWSEIDTPKML